MDIEIELGSESELSIGDMDVEHKRYIMGFRGSSITFLGWFQGS